MPRIGKFPPFGKRFFRQARKLCGRCVNADPEVQRRADPKVQRS